MISGIGVDLIEIARVTKAIDEGGSRFLERVFTDGEIAYCAGKHNRYQHFAARFAVKEAVSKAMATGWTGEFRWKDVEVVNDPGGQPRVVLHHGLRDLLMHTHIHVSISHSETHVVAVAVLEKEPT